MSRKWVITDDKGKIVDEVSGPGTCFVVDRSRHSADPHTPFCDHGLTVAEVNVSLVVELMCMTLCCVGVVGNTPLLKPYDCFQYYSSAMLNSMQGAMHGTFQMLRTNSESQQHFDAEVSPFKLIASK